MLMTILVTSVFVGSDSGNSCLFRTNLLSLKNAFFPQQDFKDLTYKQLQVTSSPQITSITYQVT